VGKRGGGGLNESPAEAIKKSRAKGMMSGKPGPKLPSWRISVEGDGSGGGKGLFH